MRARQRQQVCHVTRENSNWHRGVVRLRYSVGALAVTVGGVRLKLARTKLGDATHRASRLATPTILCCGLLYFVSGPSAAGSRYTWAHRSTSSFIAQRAPAI